MGGGACFGGSDSFPSLFFICFPDDSVGSITLSGKKERLFGVRLWETKELALGRVNKQQERQKHLFI